MSQEQYNNLLSSLLREKYALAKLRVELEGRKGKLCRGCKGFRHLAQNCRNRKEGEKWAEMPQNKFEVLKSRVVQCGVEERTIRSVRIVVKCFKCGEEGHKCRKCPQWERKEKRVARPREGKAHQEERRPACPIKEKVWEGGKKLRRAEEGEAAHSVKEEAAYSVKGEAQQEWKRSSWEVLRKRAEWYCGLTVPQDAELWELGWCGQGTVVTYLKCSRCSEEGCHVEDDWGQGVVPYWKREKMNWCGCKEVKGEGGTPTERKSIVRVEEAARPREAKAQQNSARSGKPERAAKRCMVRRTGTRSKRGGYSKGG